MDINNTNIEENSFDIDNIEDISDIYNDDTINNSDIEENSFDIDNIEDISDIYSEEVVNEILNEVPGSESESSDPTENETFDDSNIINSIDEVNTSIGITNNYLEHTNHRLDQTYDLLIVICFLLAGFVTISIFRKLFDWLV